MLICAFHGHSQRSRICQGKASSFFRTAKGTLWPPWSACADQHKKLILRVAQYSGVDVNKIIEASFDIPLTDPEALRAYLVQGSEVLRGIIHQVDACISP